MINKQAILKAIKRNQDKPLYKYIPGNIEFHKEHIIVDNMPEEIMVWNDQLKLHKSGAKIRTYRGGNRSGKSHTGAAETCFWADESHPYLITPKAPILWVVAPTQEHIGAVCWPKIKEFIPEKHWKIAWNDKGKGIPAFAEHEKGAKIWFKSSAQGRETFQGTAIDFVWMDEDIPSDIVQEVKARTIDKAGRILWTFTPLLTFTEAAIDWSEKSKRGEDGIEEYTASMFGNRHIPKQEAISVYKDWDEYERPIRAYGEFAQLEGLIYNDRIFSKQRNVYRDDSVCNGTAYLIIDPGWEVCAALLLYVDPLNRKWITDVHYGKRLSIDENVQGIIRMCGKGNIPLRNMYIDIAARQHQSSGKTIMQEFEEAFARNLGLRDKDIIIQEVYNRDFETRSTRVRKAMTTDIEGFSEFMVHERCVDWFWERRRYIFNKNGGKPQKKHDHLMNCTEYILSIEPEYVRDDDSAIKPKDVDKLSEIARRHRERVISGVKEGNNEAGGMYFAD